jgi:vanillate O-demethylase monooxygenase subunit
METFPAVIAEDRWALEKQQQMFNYPDDGYFEVFLRPDAALRRARQILTRLERAEKRPEPPSPEAAP